MAWSVEVAARAERELDSLDAEPRRRILKFLFERIALLEDPRLIGKRMSGEANRGRWLYRVGDYRLVCTFDEGRFVVAVIYLWHRREVYDRLPFWMGKARVSVIATVLNEAAEIRGLLASLERQTMMPAEVVIVDGGSTDGTWEHLETAARQWPALRVIRDESCNLRQSAGPIARGRNVAIRAARESVIACADGGCRYDADWLERLTLPLRESAAEYALGGSRLEVEAATVWDLAAAPFLGVKLLAEEPTKSCTARSMAFTREAWERVGGFPETLFIGEDVLFDQSMRGSARKAFAAGAKAIYTPRNTLAAALKQVASYAVADGVAGMRPARLMRHVLRCVAVMVALGLMWVSWWPLALVLGLELYFAFRLDGWALLRVVAGGARRVTVVGARVAFSLMVPWVVAWNQMEGARRKQYRTNRQNADGGLG